jgi:hypothetical protein
MKNSTSSYAGESSWRSLNSPQAWTDLDGLIGGFHDGVIKEIHWSHEEYVNQSLEMVFAGRPKLVVLIQLQLAKVPTLELRFSGVRECCINADKELDATALFDAGLISLLLSADGENRIVGELCEYRYTGSELLGPGPFPLQDSLSLTELD